MKKKTYLGNVLENIDNHVREGERLGSKHEDLPYNQTTSHENVFTRAVHTSYPRGRALIRLIIAGYR